MSIFRKNIILIIITKKKKKKKKKKEKEKKGQNKFINIMYIYIRYIKKNNIFFNVLRIVC